MNTPANPTAPVAHEPGEPGDAIEIERDGVNMTLHEAADALLVERYKFITYKQWQCSEMSLKVFSAYTKLAVAVVGGFTAILTFKREGHIPGTVANHALVAAGVILVAAGIGTIFQTLNLLFAWYALRRTENDLHQGRYKTPEIRRGAWVFETVFAGIVLLVTVIVFGLGVSAYNTLPDAGAPDPAAADNDPAQVPGPKD